MAKYFKELQNTKAKEKSYLAKAREYQKTGLLGDSLLDRATNWVNSTTNYFGISTDKDEFTTDYFGRRGARATELRKAGQTLWGEIASSAEFDNDTKTKLKKYFEAADEGFGEYESHYSQNPYSLKYSSMSLPDIADKKSSVISAALLNGDFTPNMQYLPISSKNNVFKTNDTTAEIEGLAAVEAYLQSQDDAFNSPRTAREKAMSLLLEANRSQDGVNKATGQKVNVEENRRLADYYNKYADDVEARAKSYWQDADYDQKMSLLTGIGTKNLNHHYNSGLHDFNRDAVKGGYDEGKLQTYYESVFAEVPHAIRSDMAQSNLADTALWQLELDENNESDKLIKIYRDTVTSEDFKEWYNKGRYESKNTASDKFAGAVGQYFRPDEMLVYKYLSEQKNKGTFETYKKLLEPILTQRSKNAVTESVENISEEHPIATSVASGFAKYVGGISSLPEMLKNTIEGKPTDAGSPGFAGSSVASGIRDTVKDEYTSGWFGGKKVPGLGIDGNWIYDTVMSMEDSLISTMFGTALGQAVGGYSATTEAINKIASATTSAVMGSQVASDSFVQGKVEGYTNEKALSFAIIRATIEGLTEKYSVETILNADGKWFQRLAKSSIAEGSEELASNWLNAVVDVLADGENIITDKLEEYRKSHPNSSNGEALSYAILMTIGEDTSTFLAGAVSGAGMSVFSSGNSNSQTLTETESKVVGKLYAEALAERQKNGEKLSKIEQKKLYESIIADMSNGQIKVDDIERVLGGDSYKAYEDVVKEEEAILKEYEELGKKQHPTLAESSRYSDLKSKVDEIKKGTKRAEVKSRLSKEVADMVHGDKSGRLTQSYKEVERKRETFKADLNQYKGKQRAAVKRAVDSGVLNNTYRSHELVNLLSKIEADKGIVFDYANNAIIKESGFAVKGKNVTAYKSGNKVTLNIQSSKAWQSAVGHEITHVLEGTDAYTELQHALYSYAQRKGEYKSRKAEIEKLYKDVGADVDSELTAELVGEYLFGDEDFVKHLTTNRNLFQRIYDEIKYLYKIATGKEQKEIARAKRMFDKAWRELNVEESAKDTGAKHSVSPETDANYQKAVKDGDIAKAENVKPAESEQKNHTAESGVIYSAEDKEQIIKSFKIEKLNNFIYVQNQVYETLLSEGFFKDGDCVMATNADSGLVVEINKSGIVETFDKANFQKLSRDMKIAKLLTIRDVVKLIESGKMRTNDIGNYHNSKSNVKYDYIENYVEIAGKTRKITIAIRKSPQKNKFWVHQIDIEKSTHRPPAGVENSKTRLLTIGAEKRISQDDGVVKRSISNETDDIAPEGDFNTPLNELYYDDFAPIRSDIAPVKAATDTNVGGKSKASVTDDDFAPIRKDIASVKTPPQLDDIAPVLVKPTKAKTVNVKPNATTAPIQSVEQRVANNLKAVEDELQDTIAMKKEVEDYYNGQIASVKKKYDYYENQNIKWTPNKNQSIPELERLKAKSVESLSAKISELEKRAGYMKTKAYSRALNKQAKMQEHAQWAEELIGDTTNWKDKKLGLQYQTNTERRNLRDIVRDENGNRDILRADAISDALHGQYNREEAAKKREQAKISKKYAVMNITKAESTYIQMLGEFRYNPKCSLTKADVDVFYSRHKKQIDKNKVDRAIEYARKDYDSLISRLNEKLREQGMKEIPYRKGYFPHFTEPKQNFIKKLLNWKTQDTEIPTSIAGLTESFRPVKKYQSFDKQRRGDTTDYNFLMGFDNYLDGALDWIYHLDTLQKRRAVENYIRYIHSDKGIQARIREIYANEEYDADEAQAQVDHVLAEGENPLNNFVQDFTTRTNILAGKKNSLDRTIEQSTNRHIYSVMTNVQNRMSANMVLANIRSAMTNFIPITQSWAQVSPHRSLQAVKEVILNAFEDDGMIDKSDFLTNRLREPEKLYKTGWDKVTDAAGVMFEVVDNFSSQVIWRSKFNQNIAKGMAESEAIRNADQFAENVMAGRSKGNEPTLFNAKNPLVKAFTMFQLEVNNQYGYLFKDVPTDLKAETKHWKLNLAKGYTTAFIGANVYNVLMEMLTGSTAAFDPLGVIWELLKDLGLFDDDEEKEPAEIATNLIDNVVEELPFVGGLFGGGRVPISSALPYGDEYDNGLSGFIGDISEGEWKNIVKEMMNPVLNVALPVAGGQIKKTVQGLRMFNTDEKHPVAGSYTDKGELRFPVEDTPGNRIQAALFGQYASENAREYFDNGYKPLTEKQTWDYVAVGAPIKDYRKWQKEINKIEADKDENGNSINGSRKEKVLEYINSLDVEQGVKHVLFKCEYPKDDSYDTEIIEYINSREDLDQEDKLIVLERLGLN